ncbi:MAG: hypothetical protein ABJM36_02485 [Algibacter sp.]|uniref:hypothetical protein n=1 Tax=Algibacter sp. TaxID=1872428 RepID=UPI00329A32DF
MNDIVVSILMIIILSCHLAAFIIGYKTQKMTLILSYLNAVFVIGMFVFWAINSLNKKQYHFEITEVFVICLEACILICALYSIIGFHNKTHVKVINSIGFAIHLLATAGMLYYISIFKFDSLF